MDASHSSLDRSQPGVDSGGAGGGGGVADAVGVNPRGGGVSFSNCFCLSGFRFLFRPWRGVHELRLGNYIEW